MVLQRVRLAAAVKANELMNPDRDVETEGGERT